jgi:hypothetical protein
MSQVMVTVLAEIPVYGDLSGELLVVKKFGSVHDNNPDELAGGKKSSSGIRGE